jgi:hypothetical protein
MSPYYRWMRRYGTIFESRKNARNTNKLGYLGSGDLHKLGLAMIVVSIERGHSVAELRLLDPLARAIESCTEVINVTARRSDEDDLERTGREAVIEDESDRLENLLGLSLVACQLSITGVISLIKKMHDVFEKQTGFPIRLGCQRRELLQRHNQLISGTTYSSLTAVDAFANYFKHRDEWSHDWSNLNKNSIFTAGVIRALGAQPHSDENLRKGYQAIFGDDNYTGVGRFAKLLQDWTRGLKKEYRETLSLSEYCD